MPSVIEQDYMKEMMIALGSRPDMRIHRQNTGSVEVIKKGRHAGVFHAGPPAGAADISGLVSPEGWRIEIETKGEKTETSEAQNAWREMISSFGGIYVRIRYDTGMTMLENVEAGVWAVERAIEERRRRV